jgi:hypothetical protein
MAIDRHLREDLLPTLRGQRGILLLKDLLIEWRKHRVLVKWISSIFASVVGCCTFPVVNLKDRYYAEQFQLVPLKDATLNSFRLLIVSPLMDSIREALLDAMRKDRHEGITEGRRLLFFCNSVWKDALAVVKNTTEVVREFINSNKFSFWWKLAKQMFAGTKKSLSNNSLQPPECTTEMKNSD